MIFVSRECSMTTISTLIPEDVARFIIEKIDSVAQMEALLLLRENPQQQWDVTAVAKRLYIDHEQAGKVLARLAEEELLVAEPSQSFAYRYQPGSLVLSQMVNRVGGNLFETTGSRDESDPFETEEQSSRIRRRVQIQKGLTWLRCFMRFAP